MTITLEFSWDWAWITALLTYFYLCGYVASWMLDPKTWGNRSFTWCVAMFNIDRSVVVLRKEIT